MFVIALFIISKKPEAITMFFNGGIGKLCREGGINRLSIEDFYVPETIVHSTVMMNIFLYTFFTIHKMYNTKEPLCQLQTS